MIPDHLEKRLSLLVIDDSRADFMLLRAMLKQAVKTDPTVVHCRSGTEGLSCLQEQPFDCVFLDYLLDDESDGIFVLREIRKNGYDVPVVAFSGCGDEGVAVEALQSGAQDYLVKGSLTPQSTRRALSNAIERVGIARELAEREQDLRNFANVAAHDLKAPLRRIAAYGQLLSEQLSDSADVDTEQMLAAITDNAERMKRLVDKLLEYTRVGRSNVNMGAVALDRVLETTLEHLEVEIRDQHAVVKADRLPVVQGDEVLLGQLFQNLVANAIKFRGDESPIVVIQASGDETEWLIRVSDNGIGIDKEFHEAVFGPFRRLHTDEEYEGSGIGLATCRRIVEQHGGRIWVESTANAGTTFVVSLPKQADGFSLDPTSQRQSEPTTSHQFASALQST